MYYTCMYCKNNLNYAIQENNYRSLCVLQFILFKVCSKFVSPTICGGINCRMNLAFWLPQLMASRTKLMMKLIRGETWLSCDKAFIKRIRFAAKTTHQYEYYYISFIVLSAFLLIKTKEFRYFARPLESQFFFHDGENVCYQDCYTNKGTRFCDHNVCVVVDCGTIWMGNVGLGSLVVKVLTSYWSLGFNSRSSHKSSFTFDHSSFLSILVTN